MSLLKIHEQAIELGYLRLDLVELKGEPETPFFFPEQLALALGGNWKQDKRRIEENSKLSPYSKIITTYDIEVGVERNRLILPLRLLSRWALQIPMVYPDLYDYLVS